MDNPQALVRELESRGFSGTGWKKSRLEGWYAIQKRTFGDFKVTGQMENEVSVLLESSVSTRVEKVEIEAEFYTPGRDQTEVLRAFASAIRTVYPGAGAGLDQAISAQREWSGDGWMLSRQRYANGGHGLVFRRQR